MEDSMENFVNEWKAYKRALAVHMAMEDGGLFNLLDRVGEQAVTREGLRGEHVEDLKLQQGVDEAVAASDHTGVKEHFDAWAVDHLAHLDHEEKVMMPLIPRAARDPVAQGQVVHDDIVSTVADNPDFDWALGWIVDKLNRFGSHEQPPDVATRVFAWGLHYAADDAQWRRWLPIIEASVSPDIFRDLVETYRLDRPGRIGAVHDIASEFDYLRQDSAKPMPFAIMRNTHEAFRASIRNMQALL